MHVKTTNSDTNLDLELGLSLLDACENEDAEIVQALLSGGADANAVDHNGYKPLHLACIYNEEEGVVQALLSGGADANAVDHNGYKPLHLACIYNEKEGVVQALLSGGADVNAVDTEMATPLHLACMYEKEVIVQALLSGGADVNAVDADGDTPLDLANQYACGDRRISNLLKTFDHGAITGEECTEKQDLNQEEHFNEDAPCTEDTAGDNID